MNAFVIVSAPFHLICLQEAILTFAITNIELVFSVEKKTPSYIQMKEALSVLKNVDLQIHEIEFEKSYGCALEERIDIYASILHKIDRANIDLVFFSDFRVQWQKDLIDGFKGTRRIMLDDGSITLALIHFHLSRNKYFSFPSYGTEERRGYATNIKRQYNIESTLGEDIELFSIFFQQDVKDRALTANSLSQLHRRFEKVDTTKEVIIGAKIVDRGICDQLDYLRMLENINHNCKGEIFYIPHRGESTKQKELVKQRFPFFNIVHLDIPIEMWIAEQVNPPHQVHGYVSTAFFIIDMCFKQIKTKCYQPSDDVINQMATTEVYGSDLYNYAEVTRLLYDQLPARIEKIYL